MIAIVWEFIVKEEAVSAFQRAYGPDGEWAALFRQPVRSDAPHQPAGVFSLRRHVRGADGVGAQGRSFPLAVMCLPA